MPRRAKIVKREILPDGRYSNRTITMFVNKLMQRGKKSTAERIMYAALDRIEQQTRKSPIDTFEIALRIECAADDVVAHARQVLHAAAADQHDGVLLQRVALARDVRRHLDVVRQAHARDLAQR